MLTFKYIDKSKKELLLPMLFDILYENMKDIAPSGLSYDEEKKLWLSNVSPAIDKAPRQIIMCCDSDVLAGFVQYYTDKERLVIEEVQLTKKHQRTMAFYRLCKYLSISLSENIKYIEAYADKRNLSSISMMKKLGCEMVESDNTSPYVYFKGTVEPIKKILGK